MNSQFNFVLGIFCLLIYITNSVNADCDKSKCPGPMKYYESIECKPVYRNPDDCCAYRYDCDHLKNRASDKCYINGKEYNIGQALDEKDSDPCDIACTCQMRDNVAHFECAAIGCPSSYLPEGCYARQNVSSCCDNGEIICPKSLADRGSCKVGEKTYMDGETFYDGDKHCVCQPDATGEKLEIFCRSPRKLPCGSELYHAYDIANNCPPVYYNDQNLQKDCALAFRCENSRDVVIKRAKEVESSGDDSNLKCIFGKKILSLGDSLEPAKDYDSVCVDCTCQVPPILTCQRLPDSECDVTKHEDFSKYYPQE